MFSQHYSGIFTIIWATWDMSALSNTNALKTTTVAANLLACSIKHEYFIMYRLLLLNDSVYSHWVSVVVYFWPLLIGKCQS